MENGHVTALWDRFGDRLFSFILGKTASREDAEDILQDVFLRVHTGLCCLEDWPAMERWLFRVTRNRIIDHYRARRPEEAYEDVVESGYTLPGEDAEDPAARLAFSLREMAEELPEPYRETLVLTEYEGLPLADVAERQGISLAAAKSRALRAREKLKEMLLECCHFELDRLGGVIDYEGRCAHCDLMRKSGGR